MNYKQKFGIGVLSSLFLLGGGYMANKISQEKEKMPDATAETSINTTCDMQPFIEVDSLNHEYLKQFHPDMIRKANDSTIAVMEKDKQNSIDYYNEEINKLKEENDSLENVPNVTNKTSMNVTRDHQSELNLFKEFREYLKQYHPDIAREVNNIGIENLEQSKQISIDYYDERINKLKEENKSLK